MASRAQLVIDVVVNSAKASKDISATASNVENMQNGLRKAAAPAAATALALAGIGAAAAKAASATQQAMGGLDAVFGKNAQVMKDWAAEAATSVGLSSSQYAEMAAVIGAQLKNLGVPMDQVAGQTNELVKIGADLAATYGGTTADAVQALGAALRGEADPAERYGLALNQTAIKAKMAADGTDKLKGSAAQAAKTQALLAMVTEQSGGALGQFARESDSAAGSAQIAQAQWQNTLSTLGTALLPVVSAAAGKLAELATFVSANAKGFQIFAVVVGTLAAAILVANAALSVYTTVTAAAALVTELASKAALGTRVQLIALAVAEKAAAVGAKIMAAAQWLLNVALSANPIGIVIILIVALVAAIIIAYQKSETFRAIVQAVGAALVTAWHAVVAAVTVAVAWIVQAWGKVVAALTAAWTAIKTSAVAIWNALVSFVTAAIQKIIAFAQGMALPYVLAFQLIAQVARIVFEAIRLVIMLFLAGAILVANQVRATFIQAWNIIKATAATAWNMIRSLIIAIAAPIIAVANRIKAAFLTAWNAIKSAASALAAAVRAVITAIAAPIIAVANRIKAAFTAAFNGIKSAASAVASAVKSAFAAVAAPVIAVANKIKSAFTSALNAIKSAASAAGRAISGAFSGVKGVIEGIIGAVQRLINALRNIKVPSIKLPSLGSSSRSAAMPSAGLSMRAGEPVIMRAGSLRAPGGSTTVINVNGALDPDAVARQIERLVSGAGRRRSGVTMRQRTAGPAAAT